MHDIFNAIGTVLVVKRDLAGNTIFERLYKNQLTTYARQSSAGLWIGNTVATPTLIAVGTGAPTAPSTSTSSTDTALWSEFVGTRKTLDYATTFLQYYSQYAVSYDQTQAIGTVTGPNPTGLISLTEAGLFDANGNLWSHVMFSGVTHDNQSTLSIQWQILHNGN
jgi:hypothetical protein